MKTLTHLSAATPGTTPASTRGSALATTPGIARATVAQHETVFNRCEEKYLVSTEAAQALLQLLGANLVPDERGSTLICNLYLDTPECRLIRRSLEKPHYKEKLRVRTYGEVRSFEHEAFFEVKKKLGGQVYKRRAALTLAEARRFAQSKQAEQTGAAGRIKTHPFAEGLTRNNVLTPSVAAACPSQQQILRELAHTVQSYTPLEPAFFVSYERCAYTYPGVEGNVRITLDCSLAAKRGRWDDFLRSSSPELGKGLHPLIAPNRCVMEIKVRGALPLELVRVLSALELYPTSFSKVGKAYQNLKSTTTLERNAHE